MTLIEKLNEADPWSDHSEYCGCGQSDHAQEWTVAVQLTGQEVEDILNMIADKAEKRLRRQ